MNKTLHFFFFLSLLVVTSSLSSQSISNINCGTPNNFSLGNSGFVGDNPTTAASSCGQCCFSGSDLDGDGDQDVSYSVENSRWFRYCNSGSTTITVDIVIDEVNNDCNVQGAVFVGPSNSTDIDCSNPGFQEYGSNPGGSADGFTFTVSIPAGQCATVMVDGYGGATCSALTIAVPCCTAPTSVNAGLDQTICAGSVATLSGTITGGIVEAGGPSFFWTPISGLASPNNASTTATPTSTTTYSLRACNSANGSACCLTDNVVINVVPAFIPNAGADIVACAPSTLSIGGSPTGPAGSTYNWGVLGTNNAGISITAGTTSANPTVSIINGATGSETYRVTVTNGPCVRFDTVVVTVGPLAVDAGIVAPICAGTSTQIGGAPTAPSGASYAWSCTSCSGISISPTNVANPTISAGLAATGTATFTVTATLGTCTNTDFVTVTINSLPTLPTATATPAVVCAGGSSTLSASGGAGSGTYSWYTASVGGTLLGSGNTLAVTPTSSTTYFVESTNPTTGCTSARRSITVNTTTAAVAEAGNSVTVCSGRTVALSGSVANPEACGTQTWTVISGAGTFSPSANVLNPTFTPSGSGTVQIRLTPCSSGGPCPVVPDDVFINVRPAPTLSASSSLTTLCLGEPILADLLATASGGTPNTPTVNSFSSTTAAQTIPNNNCASGASIPITVTGVANPLVGTTTVSICVNLNLRGIADLRLRLCAPGGSPCIDLVTPASGLGGNNMTNTCFSDASTTDISAGAAPFTGTFNALGSTLFSSLNGSATNGIWTLTATDCGTGGTAGTFSNWTINFNTPPPSGAYSFSWSPASGLSSTSSQSPTFSSAGLPVSTVVKTVVATDANGCTSTASVTMNIVDCSLLSIEQTLKLLNFTGHEVSNQNLLQWTVISDTETSLYAIEKSNDGITFEQITTVPSRMFNNESKYEFFDKDPGIGIKYYRIKIIGFNNNFEYSKTIALSHENDLNDGVNVYPIPSKGKVYIQLLSKITGQLRFEIVNSIGQKVSEGYRAVTNGNNNVEIDLSTLVPAAYIPNIYIDGIKIQRKILKE